MLQFLIEIFLRTTDLALIALALSMVYSLARFPNIALVQYATAGAFLTYGFAHIGLPIALAGVLAAAAAGFLALFLNRVIFDRLLAAGSAMAMIGSLAVAMIMTASFMLVMGTRTARFHLPPSPPLKFFGAGLTEIQLITSLASVGAVVMVAAALFLTDIGRCIRAAATNDVLARATGIDTARVRAIVFVVSGALAAFGGTSLALRGEVSIQIGSDLLLPVFAAAILGGLGNPIGAVLGALLIATAETIVTSINFGFLTGAPFAFLPISYVTAASFLLLVVTLLFLPNGILSPEVKRG